MKICEENVRNALDALVGGESLTPWDQQRIVRTAQSLGRKRRRPPFKRAATLAAAFALCVLCATGALASMPGYMQKLSMLSREALRYLHPIEQMSEDEGIRMEMLAAMNDGSSVVMYLELYDLTGQQRIDDNLRLLDISGTGMDYIECQNVSAKPDGSAIVRLVGTTDSKTDLTGKKVTLSLNSILLQNRYGDFTDTGMTVEELVSQNPKPQLERLGHAAENYDLSGGMDSPIYAELESDRFATLKAKQTLSFDGLPWLTVRSAGLVSGSLHILVDPDEEHWYNSVWFGLIDENGPLTELDVARVYLGELQEHGGDSATSDRQEQLLEMPAGADLASLRLGYRTDTYGGCIDGNWSTTFVLQKVTDTICAQTDMDMQPWRLESVMLSPVGVEMQGRGEMLEDSIAPEVILTLTDGTVVNMDEAASSSMTTVYFGEDGEEEQVKCNAMFDEPLDVNTVESISVCGTVIWQRDPKSTLS